MPNFIFLTLFPADGYESVHPASNIFFNPDIFVIKIIERFILNELGYPVRYARRIMGCERLCKTQQPNYLWVFALEIASCKIS